VQVIAWKDCLQIDLLYVERNVKLTHCVNVQMKMIC